MADGWRLFLSFFQRSQHIIQRDASCLEQDQQVI
jgi:hypothetical protein